MSTTSYGAFQIEVSFSETYILTHRSFCFKKWNTLLFTMKLLTRSEEFVLLAIWKLQDDAYTLPIRKQISEITGRTWSLGSIYTPLERLVKRNYLTSYLAESTLARGGRHKRVYQLTPKGRQALIRTREVEEAMWSGITGLALEVKP